MHKNPNMQDIPRKIHAKIGSNWSGNLKDDNGRQVMAIAHMVFGEVS